MNKPKIIILAVCVFAVGSTVSQQIVENIVHPVSYSDDQSTDSYIYAYRLSHEQYQENEEAISEAIAHENLDRIKRTIVKREANPWPARKNSKAKIVEKPAEIITSQIKEDADDIHIFPDLSRQSRKLFIEPKIFLKFGVEDAIEDPKFVKKSRSKRSASPIPGSNPRVRKFRKKGNSTETSTEPASVVSSQQKKKQYVAPPPRDVLRFELADAKIPESVKDREPEIVSRSKGKTVFKRDSSGYQNDQSGQDARKIKIITPLSPRKPKFQLYEELPVPVQKAIDKAVIEFRKKHKGGYEDGYLRFYYGDKIIKAPRNYKPNVNDEDTGFQSKWAPIVKPSQPLTDIKSFQEIFKATPQYMPPKQEKPKPTIVVKDTPIPLKIKNIPGKITIEPSISVSYEHDYDKVKLFEPEHVPYSAVFTTTQSSIPLNLPHDKNYSYATFKTPKGGYEITEEVDEKLPELAALIGQKPDDQLMKLNEMLKKDDPKKSTAPIMFPTTPIPPSSMSPPKSYAVVTTQEDPKEYKYIVPEYMNIAPQYVKEYVPDTKDLSDNYETSYNPIKYKVHKESIKIVHPVTKPDYEDTSNKYEFGYRVSDYKTGNNFGHTQKSEKDGVTSGEYHILLPDGRVQNVHYHADDDGFHADVSYSSIHDP